MTLTCEGLVVDYQLGRRRSQIVFDGLDFETDLSSIALMGPSGSGKSTLLRVMAGLQTPTQGRVTLDDTILNQRKAKAKLHPSVAMIFQDHLLISFLTVAENIRIAGEFRGLQIESADVVRYLGHVGLTGVSERYPGTLSGGEQQRVGIARALSVQPRLLLADEPTGALDGENTLRVADLLREISNREDVTVVVATHDERVASKMNGTHRLVA